MTANRAAATTISGEASRQVRRGGGRGCGVGSLIGRHPSKPSGSFLYDCEWAAPLQRWIQDRGCARPLASDLERYDPRHLMPMVVRPGSPLHRERAVITGCFRLVPRS
jgi:hypothetical protein